MRTCVALQQPWLLTAVSRSPTPPACHALQDDADFNVFMKAYMTVMGEHFEEVRTTCTALLLALGWLNNTCCGTPLP